MTFLSIVIPVYNAERYLTACVDSIVSLCDIISFGSAEVEVILVDDGSDDDSGLICDKLCYRGHPFNVRVIHQRNQGVSGARNEGLRIAKGMWIWFIDADDYIEINQEHHILLKEVNSNFVVTGFVWEENGESKSYGVINGEIPYNLWRCWFRRDFITKYGIRFVPGRKYAEDQEFILKYLICIGKIVSLPLAGIHYHYTMRPGSAMTRNGIKLKQARDIFSVLSSILFYGMTKGTWGKKWYWKEIKRIIKTLIVVIRR